MIDQIIAKIKKDIVDVKTVDKIAAMSVLKNNPPSKMLPAIYVFPISKTAHKNELIGGISQKQDIIFGAAIAMSNKNDLAGGEKLNDIENLEDQINLSILGFSANSEISPIEYLRGQLVKIDNGVVWWLIEYRTSKLLRKV